MNARQNLTKIEAGLYEHDSGRLIVRTDGWEGPRGGRQILWELARRDSGGILIDGVLPYRTLRDAAKELDEGVFADT